MPDLGKSESPLLFWSSVLYSFFLLFLTLAILSVNSLWCWLIALALLLSSWWWWCLPFVFLRDLIILHWFTSNSRLFLISVMKRLRLHPFSYKHLLIFTLKIYYNAPFQYGSLCPLTAGSSLVLISPSDSLTPFLPHPLWSLLPPLSSTFHLPPPTSPKRWGEGGSRVAVNLSQMNKSGKRLT